MKRRLYALHLNSWEIGSMKNEEKDRWEDPIVSEIHAYREAYAARFNFDLHAICGQLRAQQEENEKHGVVYVSLPAIRPSKRTGTHN
jgi:hypothetical protein